MVRISAKINENRPNYRFHRANSTEGRNGLEQISPFADGEMGK